VWRLALLALLVGCASAEVPAAPPAVSKIFLVRHGEAWTNVAAAGVGPENRDTLTSKGREQARAAGAYVASRFPAKIAIASSPLRRAVETAELIRDAHATYEFLDSGPLQLLGPGETPADGQHRALEYVEGLVKTRPVGALVVVSHSDILAFLIGKATGDPPAEWAKHQVPTGSVTEIDVGPDGSWKVVSLGVVPKD
jgi:broad specificity phosphatase PhoE